MISNTMQIDFDKKNQHYDFFKESDDHTQQF